MRAKAFIKYEFLKFCNIAKIITLTTVYSIVFFFLPVIIPNLFPNAGMKNYKELKYYVDKTGDREGMFTENAEEKVLSFYENLCNDFIRQDSMAHKLGITSLNDFFAALDEHQMGYPGGFTVLDEDRFFSEPETGITGENASAFKQYVEDNRLFDSGVNPFVCLSSVRNYFDMEKEKADVCKERNSLLFTDQMSNLHTKFLLLFICIAILIPVFTLMSPVYEGRSRESFLLSTPNGKKVHIHKYFFIEVWSVILGAVSSGIMSIIIISGEPSLAKEMIYGRFSSDLQANTVNMPFGLYVLLSFILAVLFAMVVGGICFIAMTVCRKIELYLLPAGIISATMIYFSRLIWLENTKLDWKINSFSAELQNGGLGTVRFAILIPALALIFGIITAVANGKLAAKVYSRGAELYD